jgi:hypothetical protein
MFSAGITRGFKFFSKTDSEIYLNVGYEMSARVPAKCLYRTFKGTLTCHKIIRVKTTAVFPPAKEVVSRIVITRKKFFVFGWFEPANVGSSGKHANHCTTEGGNS